MTTDNKPLVSVIIAFMNEELFLGEAVDSVLQQDYNIWELLLIDDGSNNKSTEIAKNYASKYPEKIFYFDHENHQNKGVCVSRNLGVKKANGELVAILDADDAWLPKKLSGQVGLFLKHPDIGMVAEASEYWFDWNDNTVKNVIVPVGTTQDKVYNPMELLFEIYPLKTGDAPCPTALMLKKSAILQAGGFEETYVKKYQLYEDQAFLCKIYLQEKVYISSACNNLYRQRPESVVKWVHKAGHYDMVRKYFLEWFETYLNEKQINDIRLRRLLSKALLPHRHPVIYFFTHTAPARALDLLKKMVPGVFKKPLRNQLLSGNQQ